MHLLHRKLRQNTNYISIQDKAFRSDISAPSRLNITPVVRSFALPFHCIQFFRREKKHTQNIRELYCCMLNAVDRYSSLQL